MASADYSGGSDLPADVELLPVPSYMLSARPDFYTLDQAPSALGQLTG